MVLHSSAFPQWILNKYDSTVVTMVKKQIQCYNSVILWMPGIFIHAQKFK